MHQVALVPPHAIEDSEIHEQLPYEAGCAARDRNVVCGPRKRGHLAFAPARVATGGRLHLEHDEVPHPSLAEPPGRREAGNATADDHDR